MRLLLRPFLGQNDASRRPDDKSFPCMNIYPFCSLRPIGLVSAFRSLANLTSHTLRRSFGRKKLTMFCDLVNMGNFVQSYLLNPMTLGAAQIEVYKGM